MSFLNDNNYVCDESAIKLDSELRSHMVAKSSIQTYHWCTDSLFLENLLLQSSVDVYLYNTQAVQSAIAVPVSMQGVSMACITPIASAHLVDGGQVVGGGWPVVHLVDGGQSGVVGL